MARVLLSRVEGHTGRALRFSPDALRALLSYGWPGNVRELENALEFAATVARGQTLQPEDLPPEILGGAAEGVPGDDVAAGPLAPAVGQAAGPGRPITLRRTSPGDRAVIQQVLEASGWNRV